MPQAPSPMSTPDGAASALGTPQGPPGGSQGGAQAQQQPPAPTHAQTVAALRHFDALRKELTGLLKNPDCGKSNIRSAIIDGTTKLVSERMLEAGEAVQQLGTVPDRPYDQRKWLEQHLMAANQASVAVLQHHRMAFGGQEAPPGGDYDPDNHLNAMSGLMQNYKGGNA